MDGVVIPMNVNEECLLQFLNNSGRLELATNELKKVIFSVNNDIILEEENRKKRLELTPCLAKTKKLYTQSRQIKELGQYPPELAEKY
ncbi:MAG: hypothetical protein MZV70_01655 [Desulfobacterales bacterium]|nr:hypothetical protein [Desulfobacterales bacterium]